jgi:hypothetical protein
VGLRQAVEAQQETAGGSDDVRDLSGRHGLLGGSTVLSVRPRLTSSPTKPVISVRHSFIPLAGHGLTDALVGTDLRPHAAARVSSGS